MAKIGGTQVNAGIGIETTPGTPVSATHFPKWYQFSLQAKVDKLPFTSQRGIRNVSSDSIIRRKYSQGEVGFVPNPDIFPLFAYLMLGSKAVSGPSDSAYTHTFTVQNSNASMKTATMFAENGGIETTRFAGCVCDKLQLEVSDGFAQSVASIIGGFPDTGTLTESYSPESEFSYDKMTVKFGTSLSNAAGNNATPLKALSLTLENNVQVDEAFLSGSNEPVVGGFVAGRFKASGSYSLQFADTTELAKYRANTKNAAIITFTGALIGSASVESITIKLGRLRLDEAPLEYSLDGIVTLTQQFEVEFEATDKEVQIVVVNDTTSYA